VFGGLNRIFAPSTQLMLQRLTFPSGTVNYYFQATIGQLWEYYDRKNVVLITDDHLAKLYPNVFEGHKTLIVPAGEASKDMDTIGMLCGQLLEMEATRQTTLIGIGGGVVTDIAGFLAAVYMRGVTFGFVPTSLLAMVDASVGGKNGVNLGLHKNVVGTIRQPEFILYDTGFLNTLPDAEWSNGFAEIIKYACIFDAELFGHLEINDLSFYRHNAPALSELVTRCVAWKNKTVADDEQEKGVRKLLNFGHTAGHAIETLNAVPHGSAVALGMVIACKVSEIEGLLDGGSSSRLRSLLQRYGLPVHVEIDMSKLMDLLKTDKKRKDDTIDYILLRKIGDAIIRPLSFPVIEKALATYESNN
jgi:3-dehydroquinate synthase